MDTRGPAASVPIPLIPGNSAHLLPLAIVDLLLCLRHHSNIHLLMGMLVVPMILIVLLVDLMIIVRLQDLPNSNITIMSLMNVVNNVILRQTDPNNHPIITVLLHQHLRTAKNHPNNSMKTTIILPHPIAATQVVIPILVVIPMMLEMEDIKHFQIQAFVCLIWSLHLLMYCFLVYSILIDLTLVLPLLLSLIMHALIVCFLCMKFY
jgi:hypothetical protein